MLLSQLLAQHNRRRVAGASEVHNLVSRAFRIDGNTRGAGFEHAEVGHAPFGRVVTEEHHAVAGAHACAGEESGGAGRKFVQVCVGVLVLLPLREKIGIRVLLFATIALNAHGDAGRVTLG